MIQLDRLSAKDDTIGGRIPSPLKKRVEAIADGRRGFISMILEAALTEFVGRVEAGEEIAVSGDPIVIKRAKT